MNRRGRLPRDHYVRLAANDSSVHPPVVTRRVDVSADLTQVSVVATAARSPAIYAAGATHQTITNPAHRDAAAALRAAHRLAAAPAIATGRCCIKRSSRSLAAGFLQRSNSGAQLV